MSENAVLFANVSIIILIILFLYYRHKVKINHENILEVRGVLREAILQLCNITCICARLDYQSGKIPKSVAIDVIISQPISDVLKIEHLKFTGASYEEIKEKSNEVIRSYFKQMGEKENNAQTNG